MATTGRFLQIMCSFPHKNFKYIIYLLLIISSYIIILMCKLQWSIGGMLAGCRRIYKLI